MDFIDENGNIIDEKKAILYLQEVIPIATTDFLASLDYPIYRIMEADNLSLELQDAVNNFVKETNYFSNLEHYSKAFSSLIDKGLTEEETKVAIKIGMHQGDNDITLFYNPDGSKKDASELLTMKHNGDDYQKEVSTTLLSLTNDETKSEIMSDIISLTNMKPNTPELEEERQQLVTGTMVQKLLKFNLIEQTDVKVIENELSDTAIEVVAEQRKNNNGADVTTYLAKEQDVLKNHQLLQTTISNFKKGATTLNFNTENEVSSQKVA